MLTLLSELRFWTIKDDIAIKETDLGAFKYYEKRTSSKTTESEAKRKYIEARGLKWNLDNKRPHKLKHSLKTLEDELRVRNIVYCQWKDNSIVQLMLSNGLLAHLIVNPLNGDLVRIYFDKYFIGKLTSDQIADVVITKTHILISYNENQITFVQLQKPTVKRGNLEKMALMEPKIYNVIISGPQMKKIPKHLVCNKSLDMIIIWTKSSQQEVYPWRPTVKDQDRANLHVYHLTKTKLELICYSWTENDPILVEFSTIDEKQIHSIEQKITKKGEVTIESCIYRIHKSKLQRISVTSIPLQTQVCCNAFSPDHEKLMLGCIDGSIVLFDEGRGITHLVKAAFIPTLVAWHNDSGLVLIGNERCQFQVFDISLACVKTQLTNEDIVPSNVLDLSGYCLFQNPNLVKMTWSKKPDINVYYETHTQTDCFLLLAMENGPLACLRFVGGNGLKGDVHTSGLTADVLVHKYISMDSVERAINILLSLNWDTYGAMCLVSLHKIANYIFKHPLTAEREIQLQKALGSFHVPVKPLCIETEVEFGDQVNDITVRFFHHLVRFKSFEKAFSLAIDINDADLFLKLHDRSKLEGETELAEEASKKAEEINQNCPTESDTDSHSTCSNTSCSICTDDSDDVTDEEMVPKSISAVSISSNSSKSSHPPLPVNKPDPIEEIEDFNYMPPLPFFPRNSTSVAAYKKMIIPKPELKTSLKKIKEKSLSSGNLLMDSAEKLIKKPFELVHKSNPRSYFNSLSVDHLNYSFLDHFNYNTPTANISKTQKSVVIDVVPKPIIDQTVGIPIMYDETDRAPKKAWFSTPTSSNYSSTIIHQYPLISGNIPSKIVPKHQPSSTTTANENERKFTKKKDVTTSSILANSTNNNNNNNSNNNNNQPSTSSNSNNNATVPNSLTTAPSNSKKESGEKNKVKFSNTVTVAVVPEIPRKEKLNERSKKGFHPLIMDPKRELAESLPLCHPNEDYLKDFTPMHDLVNNNEKPDSNSNEEKKIPTNIKVVHFGVV